MRQGLDDGPPWSRRALSRDGLFIKRGVMLDRLGQSHRQLEASAARLSALLDMDRPDRDALKAARWDIGARIMQHMALEDRHLFANLANDPRPAVAAIGREHQEAFTRHVATYAEHAKAWTADRVERDWAGYRQATREQLDYLAVRIRKVETELFPLAHLVSIDDSHATGISWAREAFAIKDSVAPPD